MKKLFERIFKKEPQLNYIIAEYHPIEMNLLEMDDRFIEGDLDEQMELSRLRAEYTRLIMERDILKKAMAYFAREVV